jgi:hypothetical protein
VGWGGVGWGGVGWGGVGWGGGGGQERALQLLGKPYPRLLHVLLARARLGESTESSRPGAVCTAAAHHPVTTKAGAVPPHSCRPPPCRHRGRGRPPTQLLPTTLSPQRQGPCPHTAGAVPPQGTAAAHLPGEAEEGAVPPQQAPSPPQGTAAAHKAQLPPTFLARLRKPWAKKVLMKAAATPAKVNTRDTSAGCSSRGAGADGVARRGGGGGRGPRGMVALIAVWGGLPSAGRRRKPAQSSS